MVATSGELGDAQCSECRGYRAFGASQVGKQGWWQMRRCRQAGVGHIYQIMARDTTDFIADNGDMALVGEARCQRFSCQLQPCQRGGALRGDEYVRKGE